MTENSREIGVKVKVSPKRAMKAQRGKRCIVLLILNLGIRRWRVANLKPRPLYTQERKPWCQLHRGGGVGWVVGLRSRSGSFQKRLGAMSGFCRGVNEVFALLGCYASLIGSKLSTFRKSLSEK